MLDGARRRVNEMNVPVIRAALALDRSGGDSLFQARDLGWTVLSLQERAGSSAIRLGNGNHQMVENSVSTLDDLFGQASLDDWRTAV